MTTIGHRTRWHGSTGDGTVWISVVWGMMCLLYMFLGRLGAFVREGGTGELYSSGFILLRTACFLFLVVLQKGLHSTYDLSSVKSILDFYLMGISG